MNLTNLNQFAAFARMALCGVAIGFVYDVCVIFLRGKKHLKTFSDIAFWIACAALALSSLYYANQFELRFYLVLGLLLGWGAYSIAVSKYMAFFLNPIKSLFDTIGLLFVAIAKKIKNICVQTFSARKKAFQHYNKYAKYIFGRKKDGAD